MITSVGKHRYILLHEKCRVRWDMWCSTRPALKSASTRTTDLVCWAPQIHTRCIKRSNSIARAAVSEESSARQHLAARCNNWIVQSYHLSTSSRSPQVSVCTLIVYHETWNKKRAKMSPRTCLLVKIRIILKIQIPDSVSNGSCLGMSYRPWSTKGFPQHSSAISKQLRSELGEDA